MNLRNLKEAKLELVMVTPHPIRITGYFRFRNPIFGLND